MSSHRTSVPVRQHSDLTLVALAEEAAEEEQEMKTAEKDKAANPARASVHTPEYPRCHATPDSKAPLEPIDEYDIAPVDQPPEIQALQDREPFAILARHLSGVSTIAESKHDGLDGGPQPVFEPPPDGGLEAWLVVMGAWFVLFVQFGITVGLILCGSGLGGVLLPIMLSRLFPRIGFRDSVLVLAGVSTVLFLPAWFTVKARLPPKKGIPWSHAINPWKETRYTVFVLGVALVWLNYFSPYFNANSFALSQGLPEHVATYATAILNAGSFTGRAFSGPMAGRFGVIEVFIACGVAGGISVLALWSSRAVGTAGTIIGLYLYGLFGGAVIALVAACCAQISPVREFGLRLGMMWTVASLPLLAGPQLCGLLIQRENGYTGFSLFSGITIIAGSLLAFAPVMWKRYKSRRQRILHPDVVRAEKV
ncbi:hypothetical protein QFC22_001814 [Naganishia vaughanmartiniae]|uniref:Uncharacterized protein n=1 Tax=Naganishia vaughanmartiniae TaxID=1424756 RepID=A0ACC2XEQ1_9TREE|nr:hypothetical protein QFC22_001814 [Naganishia vaughanmartiniae]